MCDSVTLRVREMVVLHSGLSLTVEEGFVVTVFEIEVESSLVSVALVDVVNDTCPVNVKESEPLVVLESLIDFDKYASLSERESEVLL